MTTDTAYIVINRSADEVFAFLADSHNLNLWSFGTWKIEIQDDGLVHGNSLMDGGAIYLRVKAHAEQKLIDYFIGQDPDSLSPRIFVRVIPGNVLNGPDQKSVLMMMALRAEGMDDDRWEGLKASHAFEVRVIKSLIETGYDHRTGPK